MKTPTDSQKAVLARRDSLVAELKEIEARLCEIGFYKGSIVTETDCILLNRRARLHDELGYSKPDTKPLDTASQETTVTPEIAAELLETDSPVRAMADPDTIRAWYGSNPSFAEWLAANGGPRDGSR
jgi:hypothetical protein